MGIYETLHPVVFMWALLWGALVYEIYEVFRCIRYFLNNGFLSTLICDILFMVISAFIVFIFALAYNFGEIRLYMLLGFSLSFFVLRITIGRVLFPVVITPMRKIFVFLKKLATKLLKSSLYLVYNLINKIKSKFKLKKGCNNG
jgi:hypothetical protein